MSEHMAPLGTSSPASPRADSNPPFANAAGGTHGHPTTADGWVDPPPPRPSPKASLELRLPEYLSSLRPKECREDWKGVQ